MMIIAVDGPAASGKGTIARRLATHFGLPHLDTGLIYRAVALAVLDRGKDLDDTGAMVEAAQKLDPAEFDEERLRTRGAGEAASVAAAIPEVRAALVRLQQQFANQPGGAVLDGRDIGTVICPHADAKIFVTAAPDVRARRRALELQSRGEAVSFEDVLADILRRDARDSGRSAAPLMKAEDATALDTSTLNIEEAVAAALTLVEEAIAGRHPT